MTNAAIDQNFRNALIGVSSADGKTILPVEIDPINGGVIVNTSTGKLIPFSYDYIAYTNTSSTVDTYVYKTGGSGGTTVATLAVTYVDSSKSQISTVART